MPFFNPYNSSLLSPQGTGARGMHDEASAAIGTRSSVSRDRSGKPKTEHIQLVASHLTNSRKIFVYVIIPTSLSCSSITGSPPTCQFRVASTCDWPRSSSFSQRSQNNSSPCTIDNTFTREVDLASAMDDAFKPPRCHRRR